VAEYASFNLVVCYTPNSGDHLKRLEYRTKVWDPDFRTFVGDLKRRKPTIIAGDLNVAHQDIDVYDPHGKERYACFTPEERGNFRELLEDGWTDTFRHLHPNETKFSYYSYRTDAFNHRRGWRIDYFLACDRILHRVASSDVNEGIRASDHMPIELIL
jgi:exodeoxyribonuclease III